MSRTLSVSVTLVGAALAAVLAPSAAYADVTTVTGSCSTTYAGALASDVLVNGPVQNGGTSGGNFTPSTFIGGATAPTSAYINCMV
ncbi:MAG: hypothetical protein QOI82_498 [Actinomycetota bacterium]|jgi:hypothetical protein|nr:hypothetical protein [Actinomycetota bacterium]